MTDLPETPFFIVGNPRSGTTLLRFMLSSHPRLYIPAESGFLPYMQIDPTRSLSRKQVYDILVRIGKLNAEWAEIVKNVETFYKDLPETTLPHLIDALYREKIRPNNALRWGDKTPTYIRYTSKLNHIFPTSQFIHIIRDGRDTAISALEKWGHKKWYMDTYYLLHSWSEHVQQGQSAAAFLGPNRYMEIRYEDLVAQPEKNLHTICDFLNETFHPDMLDHTVLARQRVGPKGHTEVRRRVTDRSVQRWRTEMPVMDQKLADRVAGPLLARLGYERVELEPFSTWERVRLGFLSLKFLITHNLRSILTASGLLKINRGKRRR